MFPAERRVGAAKYNGGVAQLGERVNGIHEVRGSIPLASMGREGGKAEGREENPGVTEVLSAVQTSAVPTGFLRE